MSSVPKEPIAPKPTALSEGKEEQGGSVLETIQRLQTGTINGSSLATVDRQACVEHLVAEGLSTAEIAKVLSISDRTVARDRKAVKEANAVSRDPRLVEQMVGRLMSEAEACVGRLRRIARDRQSQPAVRVEAERSCWQITNDLTSRLQHLGYLPMATQHLKADLTHRVSEVPSLPDLQAQIDRLSELRARHPRLAGSPAWKQLEQAQRTVLQLTAVDQVEELKNQIELEATNES